MKHPSPTAMKIIQKYVEVHYFPVGEDGLDWHVSIGDDHGISESFPDEERANKAALHVIYPIAHAIDALIAKVKESKSNE